MKQYIPKDAICLAIQFDGSNKDEFIKNMPISKANAQIWRSDAGEIKLVIDQKEKEPTIACALRVKDWLVKDQAECMKPVSDENFKAWYQEIN